MIINYKHSFRKMEKWYYVFKQVTTQPYSVHSTETSMVQDNDSYGK